jgi:nicotinate-nucleotide pyrophosphorylase (carboxylating)
MPDLSDLSLAEVFASLTAGSAVQRLLDAAFEEDLGLAGDITSRSIVPPDRRGTGEVVARQAGVIAGLAVLPLIGERFELPGAFEFLARDGDTVVPGRAVARLDMPLREMLGIERTMLNLLGRLSGIATLTRRYVEAIAGTRAVICDTRKTTPGLRHLEKYAVRCGGGTLHRMGLHDAALYKDNHLAHLEPDRLAEALAAAVRTVRERFEPSFVEVEVDELDQLQRVLGMERGLVDMVLLDNMATATLRQAVAMRDERAPGVLLEASGGVSLETIRAVAESGVDRISVGALTHSAPALDLGLDVR